MESITTNVRRSKMQLQQGDVILEKVESIPVEAKKKDNLILAEGEATGHNHIADVGLLYLLGKEMFFETNKTATIKHQEHNPIIVEPGKYKVGIIREYDPFEEEARRVVD
jgi:hypothetical protein